MRLNKYLALSTGISRRTADTAIANGRVLVNGSRPDAGYNVTPDDTVTLDNTIVKPASTTTIMFNKPAGYVVSRDGQGNKTIYDILPKEYHHLKPVGRLDKYSSGLLLLTNDGTLANELTHPSKGKFKTYEVRLNHKLQPLHRQMMSDHGVQLDDGPSKFELQRITDGNDTDWIVRMTEGRNRQIRRTFDALGYTVAKLHRTHFGNFALNDLAAGKYKQV